jgi:acetoin utilization deacetylase AcuC-like enzyme
MKCCYHTAYAVPLGQGHPFPMSKYPLLKDLLLAEGLIGEHDLVEPSPIECSVAARVHSEGYLAKLSDAALTDAEIRRLGLPWSEALWQRSRLAAAGTLLAARTALTEGLAANLAGGTHHAFADHGEGFCVLNDVAIAIAQLRAEDAIRRAVIIDLDVHQGNGTAAIFADSEDVFTFSMHGEKNYPATKMRSTLDVGLSDGIADEEYLATLGRYLPEVLERAAADIAFYVAGVDVVTGDRYGKLALSEEGLRAREQAVIRAVRSRGLPLVIVLAGGYAPTRERTAELHAHVIREACAYERSASENRLKPRWQSSSP